MAKFYYSFTIFLLLFIISSCAPGSPPSESVTLYQVNVNAEPEEAGTVSPGSAEVDEGEEIEITATANENWVFDSWQGDHNGSTNPAKVNVNSDKNISALFVKRDYPLTVLVEGEGTVSEKVIKSKTTEYPHGTTVELTANPSDGWIFSHWEGDVDTDKNPVETVVEEAKEVTAVFVIREFNLEINIEGEGTVSEQVAEEDSQSVRLTANPSDGWEFVEWKGDVTGKDNPVQIKMNESKEVTAVFEKKEYPLTISIEGEGSVSEEVVQPRTDYTHGTTVELTATPSDGWTFSHWEGDLSGSDNPSRIEVTEEKKVTAVFQEEKDFYDLTIETEGEGSVATELESGEITDELYESGSVVKLTANAAEEWVFSHWEGALSGSENPESVEMNADKKITAVFEKREYPLTVTIEGEGSVSEEVIQPRTDYPQGTTVELTASASDGWIFSHWENDLTGNENPVQIEITEAKEVTAVFVKDFFELSIETEGSGSVDAKLQTGDESDGEYEFESVVELTATPAEGWSFVKWEGDLDGSENPQTITIDSDKNVRAVFEEDPDFYDLTVQTEGKGSVGVSLQSGNELGGSYQDGSTVELSADPDDEWVFSHWEGDLDGDSPSQTITMDSDKSVTAVFEKREYPLTVNVEGEGTVTEEVVQGRVTDYPHGTIVKLTANPSDGWSFVRWEGDLSGSENPTEIEISDETEVTAIFEKDTIFFDLTVETTGDGSVFTELQSGSISDGSYEEESTVQLTATADNGWSFSHWEGDLSGSDNQQTITMDSDKSVTAVFEENPETYALTVNTDGEGSVAPGSGEYEEGTEVELTATAEDGWSFSHWEGDLSGSDPSQTITMDSDKSVIAVFEEEPEIYTLTISTEGEGSVTPESGEYEEGTEVELTATAEDGWSFSHWEGDISGSDNSPTITMDSDKSVTAVFEEDPEYFDLIIQTDGEGSVDVVLQSGDEVSGSYEEGSTVELTAVPGEGWSFSTWEGDLNGRSNPRTITIDSDKSITAEFEQEIDQFTLTIDTQGNGTVTPESGGVYDENTEVDLEAEADAGWNFSHWEGEEIDGSDNPEQTITMNSDKSITAVFEEEPEQFTLTSDTQGSGTVSPASGEFEEGSEVDLEAEADEGWSFSLWEGDLSGSENPQIITMDSDKSVTAVFEEDPEIYTLTVSSDGEGSVAPESGDHEEGAEVELTATASEGWSFSLWEGDLSGSENPQSITMDSDKSVTAVFEEIDDDDDD